MYANDLIEQLSRWPSDSLVYSIDTISKVIANSVKFHLGEFPKPIEHMMEKSAFENKKLFVEENQVRFPFPAILLSYSDTSPTIERKNRLRSTRRCILAIKPNAKNSKSLIIPFSFYDERKIWTPPVMAIEYSDDFFSGKFFQFFSNESFNRNGFLLSKEEISEIKHDLICEASMLNIFLKILECKNIATETICANEKINRKRIRKKKLPLFEYKILKVSLPAKQKNGNKETISGIKYLNRVHLCRGHFKEYTTERPLLGKYVGRYWWQPTIRGKSDGFVEKEYLVSVS